MGARRIWEGNISAELLGQVLSTLSLNSGATGFKSRSHDGLLELICCFIQCLQEHAVFVPELRVCHFF